MSRFLPLTVEAVRPETRHAVVLTLRPRSQDREAFRFVQGQYLTFRRKFEGEELRRCYSICSAAGEDRLRVAIKRVGDGWFSTWANTEIKPGDTLDAMPPAGSFHIPLAPETSRHYLMFALGSGITPVLSLVKTLLGREPKSRVTLVYANRSVNSIMFRDELEDLKDSHLGRLAIVHLLKSDVFEIDLFAGRLDAAKCEALFSKWIDVASIDYAFICGPEPMMLTVAQALREHGLADERIKFELFKTAPRGAAPIATRKVSTGVAGAFCEVTATLDGLARSFSMPMDGTRVVDAAMAAGIDAPHSCKAGVCSSCRARVIEGEYEMEANFALEDYELRRGYVLTCQTRPLTRKLVLTYDA